MLIAMTGASGFIGRHTFDLIKKCENPTQLHILKRMGFGFSEIPDGTEVIVHLAGRAHILSDASTDPAAEFHLSNYQMTMALAHMAIEKKVRRFVFMSSIGVNGSNSATPFNVASLPTPSEPYAVSKLEAEEGLRKIAAKTGIEVVIVRPPLVYGPICPGNFLRLLDLVYKGLPLPIGAVNNLRSLIGVNNLADFLVRCVEHPAAANKTFLIADKPDISTPDMMRVLAEGMGRPSRLVPAPYGLIHGIAGMLGKRATLEKLCGTLQIDSSFARETLGWTEPTSLREGLLETGRWYAQMKAGR
jgi:nucleoside-diphosphate-sugar epimerase